jgi:glucokinase
MGKPANPCARALVADIGGTNARFALADLETGRRSGNFPAPSTQASKLPPRSILPGLLAPIPASVILAEFATLRGAAAGLRADALNRRDL